MNRREFIDTSFKAGILLLGSRGFVFKNDLSVSLEQITGGNNHHFFGYIGQSLTIPWNASGNRILTLTSSFHNHLPGKNEPAEVSLIHLDKKEGDYYPIEKVDESCGWNLQQGTMYYWHPANPEHQFFLNDRDQATGKVFTALFDTEKNKRIREFRFEDTPVGNGGVCPQGKSFLAINYARMARLRPVTGYRDTTDWTEGVAAPEDDGIFLVDIDTGSKKLLVSFAKLEEELQSNGYDTKGQSLFINHTLWNRNCEYVYFFVRAGWQEGSNRADRINVPCTIKTDGSSLVVGHQHIGGHPEWEYGSRIIGRQEEEQVIYDVESQKIVDKIGNPKIIPNPEGDISLSPDGKWFVNGHSEQGKNYYTIIRLSDGKWVRSQGVDKGKYSGDLRIDPAPRWNRESNQILVDGLTENGTRQMFIIKINDGL